MAIAASVSSARAGAVPARAAQCDGALAALGGAAEVEVQERPLHVVAELGEQRAVVEEQRGPQQADHQPGDGHHRHHDRERRHQAAEQEARGPHPRAALPRAAGILPTARCVWGR